MSVPRHAVIPMTVEDIDAEWLGAMLGAEVRSVTSERVAVHTAFSSVMYRLTLEGDGVPASLIAKLPTTTAVRSAMDLIGGYAREVAFYRDVAEQAPLRTPKPYFAQLAEDSTDFAVLMEDLGSLRNGNHLEGLALDDARAISAQLAGLHMWSSDEKNSSGLDFPTLDTPTTRQMFPVLFGEGWEVYLANARTEVPAAIAEFGQRFAGHSGALLDGLTERRDLVHGDIRADNVFFGGDKGCAIVDFQMVGWGCGASDIGYLVSQGLTTETRAGQDEELLREYLDLLGADYSFDDAWRHYRQSVAFYLLFPVVGLRGWDDLPEPARELCLRLIERASATIEDIDALAVLR